VNGRARAITVAEGDVFDDERQVRGHSLGMSGLIPTYDFNHIANFCA
jgi:hypothetical protein